MKASKVTKRTAQTTLEGLTTATKPAKQNPYGRCHPPKGYDCMQDMHAGGKCKTRPCKHCDPQCFYWRPNP